MKLLNASNTTLNSIYDDDKMMKDNKLLRINLVGFNVKINYRKINQLNLLLPPPPALKSDTSDFINLCKYWTDVYSFYCLHNVHQQPKALFPFNFYCLQMVCIKWNILFHDCFPYERTERGSLLGQITSIWKEFRNRRPWLLHFRRTHAPFLN